MKKSKKESKTLKDIPKKTSKKQKNSKNKSKRVLTKKIVIPISIVLIVILLATLIVYTFIGKQKNTVVEAEKTELNLANNEYMQI